MLELVRDEYGRCERDQPTRNDCYWGKDSFGRNNGCLKVGWHGRACKYWKPASDLELEPIIEAWTLVA